MILQGISLQPLVVCRRQKTRVGSEENQRGKINGLQLSVGEQSRSELNRVACPKRMSFEKSLRFEQNRVGQVHHSVLESGNRRKVFGKSRVVRRRNTCFAAAAVESA